MINEQTITDYCAKMTAIMQIKYPAPTCPYCKYFTFCEWMKDEKRKYSLQQCVNEYFYIDLTVISL